MAIVVPEFPKVVEMVISNLVDEVWTKYPVYSQACKFVEQLAYQIECEYEKPLMDFPKGLVADKLMDGLAGKMMSRLR